jgi:DNA anti-recombination protein RmuC
MADDPNDKDDSKRTPLKAMRDAWMALTGALATAETEVQKRFYESLGVPPDANLGAELMARMKKNREEFERRIDDGVKAAVARVRAPIDKEIASLKERVEKLQQKVEQRRSKEKK